MLLFSLSKINAKLPYRDVIGLIAFYHAFSAILILVVLHPKS